MDKPNLALANAEKLRAALRPLADFGVPDSFPLSAFGSISSRHDPS